MQRTKSLLLAFISVVILLSGCKTNNDVVSTGLIQKRKYRPGFHTNFGNSKIKKATPTEKRGGNYDDGIVSADTIQAPIALVNTPASKKSKHLFKHIPTGTSFRSSLVRTENSELKWLEEIRSDKTMIQWPSKKPIEEDNVDFDEEDDRRKASMINLAGILTTIGLAGIGIGTLIILDSVATSITSVLVAIGLIFTAYLAALLAAAAIIALIFLLIERVILWINPEKRLFGNKDKSETETSSRKGMLYSSLIHLGSSILGSACLIGLLFLISLVFNGSTAGLLLLLIVVLFILLALFALTAVISQWLMVWFGASWLYSKF